MKETRAQFTRRVTAEVTEAFRTFGGGQDSNYNPITKALKNEPPQFAAGVNVEHVVFFVLDRAAIRERAKNRARAKR